MNRTAIISLSLVLSIILTVVVPSEGTAKFRLYGSSSSGGSGNPSNLYEVDPATGLVALIGPIGFSRVGAMATHPTSGIIYATGERLSDSSSVLITIDPITGVGTEVISTGIASSVLDIDFRSDGTLFIHLNTKKFGDGISEIYSTSISSSSVSPQDALGGFSFVGDTGVPGGAGGLAMTDTDSLISQMSAEGPNLYGINQLTGVATLTGAISFVSGLGAKAMKFHPETGELYAVVLTSFGPGGGGGGAGAELQIIDLVTGITSLIGTTLGALDGITFVEDSPPTITLNDPNGDETIEAGSEYTIRWSADDDIGVDHVDISFSPGHRVLASTSGGGGVNPSFLHEIDRATGVTTEIGAIGFNRVGSMDQHPATGVIYGVGERPADNQQVLITIDQTSGVGTEVGLTNFPGNISDISFNPAGNILYGAGLDQDFFTFRLLTFDLATGDATVIGGNSTAVLGGALAFFPSGLWFQQTDSSSPPWFLAQVNPVTGTFIGGVALEFPTVFNSYGRFSAMDLDPILGRVYSIAKNGTQPVDTTFFGKIDNDTLKFVPIGAALQNTMDGMVWAVQPCLTIAADEPNDGEYTWMVPGNRTYDGIIKVTAFDTQNQERTDISDTTFIIRPIPPQITVVDPLDGEILVAGQSKEILWVATDNGSVASVDIAYVVDLAVYTTTGDGPGVASELYVLDPETGFGVLVGNINFNRVGAISMDPETGILYAAAARPSDGTPVLITIDPVTGAGQEVGRTGIPANITDLAFDRVTNLLYGQRRDKSGFDPNDLYTFEITDGAASLVGSINRTGRGGGLAFSLANQLRLALVAENIVDSWIYLLNKNTGGAISDTPLLFADSISFFPGVKALDYHPLHGLLYGVGGETAGGAAEKYLQINASTSEVSVIAPLIQDIDGMAFGSGVCIPIATGESNDGSYTWTVPDAPTATGRVKVIAYDNLGHSWSDMSDGFFTIGPTTDAPLAKNPATTFLAHAAPNPFQNATTIRFGLARPGPARLAVYDARGRLTRELVSGPQEAGPQVIQWDGRDHAGRSIASGVYILRLEANGQVMTRRMSLVR